VKILRLMMVTTGILAANAPVFARADEPARLQDEWKAADQKWRDAAKSERDRGREPDRSTYPAREFRPRFRRAAETYAGKPSVIPILLWLVHYGEPSGSDYEPSPDARWAIERLTRDHAADPSLKDCLAELDYAEPMTGVDPLVAFFEKVIAQQKDKEVQADATLYLAMLHQRESVGDEDATPPRPPNKARSTMASKLFHRLMEDYPDSHAAAAAKGCLFEIQHLQVGMKAPDLVGEDVDGNKIRLSQFAGQVVMLDFWGFW
jgi:hypothetical protein